ncbi:MAG: response regulator [Verrucomicrobia bacterium]|nr:response regulator [Verrucomicrobiota bacterium]
MFKIAGCEACELEIISSWRQTMWPAHLSNLTIAVVEDHDDARKYLALFLSQVVGKVVVARNVSEGLEAIKKSKPDLVLTDIRMPGADGFELLREVRALGSDSARNVPVIAMTALFTRADRVRILDAGFQGCLPKPFTPDKLLEAILKVLNE